TAGGKLLLAHLPLELRKNYLKTAQLSRFTENTLVHKDTLEEELDRILALGYSVNREEYAIGIMAIGVPIVDKNGTAMSALALHAPIARLSIEDGLKSLDRLKRAAEELGRIWL
ncbi:MAG: IclR family transcriptional regulator domain-containing protein, partial [Methyloligellaceae bacterium]